jgi:hypothetical protein
MSQPDPEDGSQNTEMFRAFVDRHNEVTPQRPSGLSSPAFRLVTLLGGLVVLALVVLLLFR